MAEKQTSIRFKILIPMLIFFIVGNILSYLLIVFSLNKSASRQINMDLSHVISAVSSSISDANEREKVIIDTISNMPQIKSDEVSLYEKSQIIFAFLNVNKGKYIDMCILDTEGNAYVGGTTKMISFAERDYFKEAMKGKFYIEKPFINKVTSEMAIFYSTPVYNANNQIINIVFSVVKGYKYCELMKSFTVGKGSNPLIFDRNTGVLVGSSDIELFDKLPTINQIEGLADISSQILSGSTNVSPYYIGPKKVKNMMLASYMPVQGTSWTVVAPAPLSDFTEEFSTIQSNVRLVYIVVILVTVVFIYLLLIRILYPLKFVRTSIKSIAQGDADLTKRLPESKHHDEISNVVNGFNQFIDMLNRIISEVKESKQELSKNGENLDGITVEATTALVEIIDQLEQVKTQLVTQVESVNQTIEKISSVGGDINSLNGLMEKQVAGVTEASSSVENMIDNINSVGSKIETMSISFESLLDKAKDGCKLQENVNYLIRAIETQSETLGAANVVIASIAEQTNLLAMNAAIEAAHAGEAGKGFSVVADEIRKLSETSSGQSNTIGEQLSAIQKSIEEVVSVSEKTLEVFNTVIGNIDNTNASVKEIRTSIEDQQQNSVKIENSLEMLNTNTQEVHAASEQMQFKNNSIQSEIQQLEAATNTMKSGFDQMEDKMTAVKEKSAELNSISNSMKNNIMKIGKQIDLFKV